MTAPDRPTAVLALGPARLEDLLFPPATRARLDEVVRVLGRIERVDAGAERLLAGADVLVTGWGAPRLTRSDLEKAARLRGLVHAGGSAAAAVDLQLAHELGLEVSNAGTANAVPVAEYTLAMILLAGKDVLRSVRLYRDRRGHLDREAEFPHAGNYRRVVGILGASRIGRLVLDRLRAHDLEVLLFDPTVDEGEAVALGATKVELAELLRRSAVVSVHVPVLPGTVGLLGAAELALMPDGATLINTARGIVVDAAALTAELRSGRLDAVLDVTDPEPLPPDDPLWELPNVVLTPHMAGAVGNELSRIGELVVDEVRRLLAGEPPAYRETWQHPTSSSRQE
jgi:phosphoglycerate dehydrogenase-like enzyme